MEHGENEFPIPRRRPLVVDIAAGKRVAVLRARVNSKPIAHLARL